MKNQSKQPSPPSLPEYIDDLILSVKYSEKGGIVDQEAKAQLLSRIEQEIRAGREAENLMKKEFYTEANRQLHEEAKKLGHETSFVIQANELVLKEIDLRLAALQKGKD